MDKKGNKNNKFVLVLCTRILCLQTYIKGTHILLYQSQQFSSKCKAYETTYER